MAKMGMKFEKSVRVWVWVGCVYMDGWIMRSRGKDDDDSKLWWLISNMTPRIASRMM